MGIGIDVGRSGTKVAFKAPSPGGGLEIATFLIPSAFAPASLISDEAASRAAAADTVEVGGRSYWVGDTALLQGRDEMVAGLDDKWVTGAKHEALLRAALKRLVAAGVQLEGQTVVVGLPSRGFAENRMKYQARAMEISPKTKIKVVPQSMGPYYSALFDDQGNEQPGVAKQSVAVIEVGQFTTDLARVDATVPVESALDSTDGMRVAAEALIRAVLRDHEITLDMAEATTALVTGRIKNFGKEVDVSQLVQLAVQPVAERVADKVLQVFGSSLRTVDRIIVAGGGAPLLRAPLLARLPTAEIADDARFCVARGFLRFAAALERAIARPAAEPVDLAA